MSLKGKLYQKLTFGLFVFFLSLNLSYYIILLFNEWLDFIQLTSVLLLVASIMSTLISFCLFMFGYYLINEIRQSLEMMFSTEGSDNMDIGISMDVTDRIKPDRTKMRAIFSLKRKTSNKYDNKEIYYSTRLKQIQINIYVVFISDCIQLVICLLEYFFMKNNFGKITHALMPRTIMACIIILIDELCSLGVSLSYFFIFYFVLKRTYFSKGVDKKKAIIKSDDLVIMKSEEDELDIKNYLSFRDSVRYNKQTDPNETIDEIKVNLKELYDLIE